MNATMVRPEAAKRSPREKTVSPTARQWAEVIFDVECRRTAAEAVLREWAEHANIPAAFGLVVLLEQLESTLDKEGKNTDWEDHLTGIFPRISCEILVVSDVVHAVNQQHDEQTLYAVGYLLDMCKQIVDTYTDELMAAHHARKAGSPA